LAFFKTALPGLTHSSSIFNTNDPVSYRGESARTGIIGIQPDHFILFSIPIAKGRRFLPQDIQLRRAVCVLRPDIAKKLFKDEDPLDKVIQIGEKNYTVIGLTERLEQSFLSDGSDNNTIFVPEHFIASRLWGGRDIRYWIYVMKFDSINHVNVAINRINNFLNNKYGWLRGESRFRVEKLDSYIGIVEKILNIISTLILVIASISLLVGGLGIMNIMLVTVTERTREIGVRMAIGAKRQDILAQFIIEAVTLCLLGGGAGIVFGTGLAALVCTLLKWEFIVSIFIALGALGISTVIGLIFGIYPAYKASRLTPIEALRSEN
ncbi:MAG: FtsX-like permease family protein, partial [Spirochaetota bacterium]